MTFKDHAATATTLVANLPMNNIQDSRHYI